MRVDPAQVLASQVGPAPPPPAGGAAHGARPAIDLAKVDLAWRLTWFGLPRRRTYFCTSRAPEVLLR
jgi:hypothetical protein